VKVNKYILVLLFVSLSFAGRPHSGLWVQTHIDKHFYTEIFFLAELGVWHFEYTSYLVNLDGEPMKRVATSQYLSGTYYRLKGNLNSILVCYTEKYIMNGVKKNFLDKKGKVFRYAFRLTTLSTATFGRIINNDIYEAYYFVKRVD
jgi:hypothetical protein